MGNELMVVPQPPDDEELYARFGQKPTKFRREYIDQARVLCEEGMTDKELAKFFGVNKSTLYDWQFIVPEFAAAMKLGKESANDRMERRAYEVAMGYSTTITETIKVRLPNGGEALQTIEKEVVIPPNPDMLRWMLKNRRPDQWRDKTEQVMTGEVVHLTVDQQRERLKSKLEQLRLTHGGK